MLGADTFLSKIAIFGRTTLSFSTAFRPPPLHTSTILLHNYQTQGENSGFSFINSAHEFSIYRTLEVVRISNVLKREESVTTCLFPLNQCCL